MKNNTKKGPVDFGFLIIVILLVIVGFIMIFSTTSTLGLKTGDAFYFVKRHILYIIAAVAAMIAGINIDYKLMSKYSSAILGFAVICLFLVFIPGLGISMGGASRWLNLGMFSMQPSELTKFAIIIFTANSIVNKKNKITNFSQGLLPILLVVGAVSFLVFKEPDLGTSIVIVSIAFFMLFIGGARISHLIVLFIAGILALVPLSIGSEYRRRRLLSFINPWVDPQDVGFHIIQSLLAIGSGGLFGLGLGASKQKFFYLPQQYTDFIFAIICEETGFIGATLVISLFILFILRGIKIIREAPDKFSALMCSGIVLWISVQASINIGVVTGIMPITGMPLPFISYGGTSLVIIMFAVGLMLNVSSYRLNK